MRKQKRLSTAAHQLLCLGYGGIGGNGNHGGVKSATAGEATDL